MPDLFISHAHEDKDVAMAICEALEERGFTCWIAPRDIPHGSEWVDAIVDGLSSCRVMVLVFSTHSNGSRHVKRELHLAAEAELPILPVRIEDVPLAKGFRYFLEAVQWVDGIGALTKRSHDALAQAADRLLGREERSTRDSRPAPPRTSQPEASTPPPSPGDPWQSPLDAAIAAGETGDWSTAAQRLAEATRLGVPAIEVPATLTEGVAAWEEAPTVDVIEPQDGVAVPSGPLVVRGSVVSMRATDRVFVNGLEARLDGHAFSAEVTVPARGTFLVAVEVRDGGMLRGKPRRLSIRPLERWRAPLDAAIAAADSGDWQMALRRLGEARTAGVPAVAIPAALANGIADHVARTARRRALLEGWAEPVGTDVDVATGYPKRIRRMRDGGEMVLIPAGTFQMGAVPVDGLAQDDEKPRHTVTLTKAYYMDECDVTVGQWRKYVASGGGNLPALRGEATDAHPIHLVDWEDAAGFARWAGASLPTEAQWERAAKGGHDEYVYPWGVTDHPDLRNGAGTACGLTRVKAYPPNGYGLYDMSGNVRQWCADRYSGDYYATSPPRDPSGPASGSACVVRGGGWYAGVGYLRATSRDHVVPTARYVTLGFRLARSL